MQCRRVHLPTIEPLATFAEVAARPGAVLADLGGAPMTGAERLVLVGPEGGWTDAEAGASIPRVVLGSHVLRAETAAVAAGVVLCARRAGLL